jgi:hypothetical protein
MNPRVIFGRTGGNFYEETVDNRLVDYHRSVRGLD